MIADIRILKDNYYSKIKLYGYSLVKKNTTYVDKEIEKYIFYLESHSQKYQISLISFNGLEDNEQNKYFDIKIYPVDSFKMPTPKMIPIEKTSKGNSSVEYYKYNKEYINLSLHDYNEANRSYHHKEKGDVAKWITNNKYDANFIISQGFGISIENIDKINDEDLKNSKEAETECGCLYINKQLYEQVLTSKMQEILDVESTQEHCYESSQKINELEKLIEL